MHHQGFHGPVCFTAFVSASDFSSPVHFSGDWMWLYFSQTSDQTRTRCQKLIHSQSEVCGRCSGFLFGHWTLWVPAAEKAAGSFCVSVLELGQHSTWYAVPAFLCLFLVQQTFSHAASPLLSPLHISFCERVIMAQNKLHCQGALSETYIPVLTCIFFAVGSWSTCLYDTLNKW